MENQQENTTNPSETNPRPTDDVQLTIETVTPDTHQSIPQTEVNTEKTEGKIEDANDSEENEKIVGSNLGEKGKSIDQEVREKEEGSQDDQSKEPENSENINNDEVDDERDKIETISP